MQRLSNWLHRLFQSQQSRLCGRMAEISELIESAELIEAVAVLDAAQAILEATGEYYYEDITLKRWILGDGGRAGNCEICVDNADRGWIDMDDVWDSIDGSI